MKITKGGSGARRALRSTEFAAILFDLDGVLIDSTESVTRHWKEWAATHGLDLDEIMQVAYGVRTIETMRRIAPHLDAQKEAAVFGAHEVDDTEGVVPIDGAGRMLAALPQGRWAIVTSCGANLARARLTQAHLPIPRILITADDIGQGKPAPDPYLAAAKQLGIAAKRCVVIEDAPAGIEAGIRAGMAVIGLTTTHRREELFEKGADVVIDQLASLSIQEAGDRTALILDIERK
jgi:sugar-phosphatase